MIVPDKCSFVLRKSVGSADSAAFPLCSAFLGVLSCLYTQMSQYLHGRPIDIESLKIDCLRSVVCLLLAPAIQG